jgi:hypothetical protein
MIIVTISCLVFFATVFFSRGCKEDSPSGETAARPVLKVNGYAGCKARDGLQSRKTLDTSPSIDCIEYHYDGISVLTFKHINAGFNCCPAMVTADLDRQGNVLALKERESYAPHGPCRCLCLFDVDYIIDFVLPGQYTIRVFGLYLQPGDAHFEFDIDLSESTSGRIEIERDYYPWGS